MCRVNNAEECKRWYQYMDTIMIINAWDSFCMAENGCDWDSDILFSTNNDNARCHELTSVFSVIKTKRMLLFLEVQ